MSRVLWLATADARGHLMRCQLMVHQLRARGHEVDAVTTSEDGQAFLAEFGVTAHLLSDHYRVEFDERQDMRRIRTEWRMFRYLTSPWRFWRDLRRLERFTQNVDLVVNDSFHPALLLVRSLRPWTRLPPIVHVYGKHLRQAVEENYERRWPAFLERIYRRIIGSSTDGAFARIQHSLGAPAAGQEIGHRTYEVPPVLAPPTRSVESTRRTLRMGAGEKLAVVYLNPHFKDAAIASALEQAALEAGCRLHAVGEGFANRPGWIARDVRLVDAINAANVFISAPGAAGLGQALALDVPFIAIVTDQPEQRGNLSWLAGSKHRHAIVHLGSEHLEERLTDGLAALARSPSPAAAPRSRGSTTAVLSTWTRILERLLMDAEALNLPQEERSWRPA